nr:MAG TPA: hypothetical protein [Caudoviricetes sp.]
MVLQTRMAATHGAFDTHTHARPRQGSCFQ